MTGRIPAIGRLGELVGKFQAEVRNSGRLALALAALLVVLWVQLTLTLSSSIDDGVRRLADLSAETKRYAEIANDPQWPAKQAEAEASLQRVRQRLWVAESEGIARADLQEWLNRTARETGLGRPQVRGERELGLQATPGLIPIAAQLSADFTPQSLTQFLARVAAHDRLLVVLSLRAQKTQFQRIDIVVATYLPSAPAAAAPPPVTPPRG
jgi:hypothetical protein